MPTFNLRADVFDLLEPALASGHPQWLAWPGQARDSVMRSGSTLVLARRGSVPVRSVTVLREGWLRSYLRILLVQAVGALGEGGKNDRARCVVALVPGGVACAGGVCEGAGLAPMVAAGRDHCPLCGYPFSSTDPMYPYHHPATEHEESVERAEEACGEHHAFGGWDDLLATGGRQARAPARPTLVVVGATGRACQDLTMRSLGHYRELQLATYFVPGDELPRGPLVVAWATPREQLPAGMQDFFNNLEREGALTTWRGP